MQGVPDEEFIDAVRELHPADTVTGGVKASQVAGYLGMSTGQVRARLRRLREEERLRCLGGLRGPTYAPTRND